MRLQMPDWCAVPIPAPDESARRSARERQGELTKPPGSLGRLESLAVHLAGLQGTDRPGVDPAHITVFAGDHGIAEAGVSAFPQTVTQEMVRNFVRGGAAISVLAREQGATLEVVDTGMVEPPADLPDVVPARAGAGTRNFLVAPAMDQEALTTALDAGREAVNRAFANGARCFIGGEMGIANTTSAAAVACAMLDADPELLAGPGTGLDATGVMHKVDVLRRGMALHPEARDPVSALAVFGGYEIAALAGACIAAAGQRMPVLVDGFISSVAAMVAVRELPAVQPWLLFGHRSAEPGHDLVLRTMGEEPVLDLGMRLGEGSGAAVALGILRLACRLHGDMATFGEAGVSQE